MVGDAAADDDGGCVAGRLCGGVGGGVSVGVAVLVVVLVWRCYLWVDCRQWLVVFMVFNSWGC